MLRPRKESVLGPRKESVEKRTAASSRRTVRFMVKCTEGTGGGITEVDRGVAGDQDRQLPPKAKIKSLPLVIKC